MTRYMPLSDFREFYKSLVEKPGEATHSAKFDRCVADVKAKGSGANAYAVCTAQLGGEAFKSWMQGLNKDAKFDKELDEFMRTLGISKSDRDWDAAAMNLRMLAAKGVSKKDTIDFVASRYGLPKNELLQMCGEMGLDFSKTVDTTFAGKEPKSLLARQDLEGTQKFQKRTSSRDYEEAVDAARRQYRPNSMDGFRLVMWLFHNFNVDNQEAEEIANRIEEEMEEKSTNQTKKAVNVIERVRQLKAEGSLRMNTLQTLINEGYAKLDILAAIDEVFGKGAVEQTGKVLDEALKDAPNADTRAERKSLVETIKDAQLKRQKATIQARTKEAGGKSFKETWKGLSGG